MLKIKIGEKVLSVQTDMLIQTEVMDRLEIGFADDVLVDDVLNIFDPKKESYDPSAIREIKILREDESVHAVYNGYVVLAHLNYSGTTVSIALEKDDKYKELEAQISQQNQLIADLMLEIAVLRGGN